MADWFHLLNWGYFFPIVGSSDSHGIDKNEPGYAGTYVYYKGEKGKKLDTSALIQAMKKGQSFVSFNKMLIEGEEDDLLGGVAFPAHILFLSGESGSDPG